jgi:mRNA-degrading endonuclease RelE of RelBE toxin-antitoxin system
MRIRIDQPSLDAIRRLPPELKRDVRRAIDGLGADPFGPAGGGVKRLRTGQGTPALYRIRVREWRIAYRVEPGLVQVVKVFHRSEGYAWLERMGY